MHAEPALTIEVRTKASLSPRETARLEGLTLGGRGCMQTALRQARPEAAVVTARKGHSVVGWSIPSEHAATGRILNVYVQRRVRRRGIGRRLLEQARAVFGTSAVRAHDGLSRRFFAATL